MNEIAMLTIIIVSSVSTLAWVVISDYYEIKMRKLQDKLDYYESHYYLEYKEERT